MRAAQTFVLWVFIFLAVVGLVNQWFVIVTQMSVAPWWLTAIKSAITSIPGVGSLLGLFELMGA